MPRIGILLLCCACAARSRAAHDAFVLDGTRFPVTTRVVRWDQPGGLDGNPGGHFGARPGPARDIVTQVVLHYDVAVTSANCQHILDRRGLSCHFLLDLDGTIYQYDFTPAQYAALAALLRALDAAFPNLTLDTPAATTVLPDATSFRGILGHYHLTRNKIDPGPAFAWDRVIGKQP